jgi:hypothetical protein
VNGYEFCFHEGVKVNIEYRRKLTWLGAILSCVLGCGQATEKVAKEREPAELVPIDEPALALEEAGIKFSRDERSGQIALVDASGIEIDDALAAQIAGHPSCTKLTITASSMTNVGWTSLAALRSLQQLDLRGCTINNSQLQAAVSGMPELRALRLSGQSGNTSVDDDGLSVLSKCTNLKVFAADELFVSEDGLQHLSNCPQLAELYLKGTLVSDDAMSMIAEMKNLRKLRLAKTKVSTAGLELLSALPLEELDVSECSRVLDDSMVAIGKMVSLKRLNLWRDVVTDDGAAHLKGLINLEWLNLDNTHLRDAGLEHLSNMTKLTFLHIGSTGVSDAGMEKLSPLVALKDLKVTRTSVTEEGAAVVTQAIPGVAVQLKYIEGE